MGTARGLETRLVPEAGFRLDMVPVGQLKGVSLATRARTLLDLPLAVLRCRRLLREFGADVVVGVGGYASGPGMAAALLMGVPTLAFEPNAVPGLANRLVGKRVSAAAVNFPAALRYFRNGRVTGIPVRAEFFSIAPAAPGARLLVFGGSQGARVLNEVLPRIVRQLMEAVPGLTVLHQSGARHGEATLAGYEGSGADAGRWRVADYVDDMSARFAEASLILCRSGASTVAELAAAGRAAVLVPFPGAADDHQLKNAEEMSREGAAVLLEQGTPGFEQALFERLVGLLGDSEGCLAMGRAAKEMAHPAAAQEIAGMCVELAAKDKYRGPSLRSG